MKTFVSDISGKKFPMEERISAVSVRKSLMDLILKDHPDFDHTKYLAISELNDYREKYINEYLTKDAGETSELESKVLASISEKTIITDGLDDDAKPTVGERVADKVASFGGSWRFIIIFLSFLVFWMILNAFILIKGYDPYPFILLNLILSCLAALQAPVIMMSQNRQSDKDRVRSKNDYLVNLKSELELRQLHEKIDHMMLYQEQRLLEVQKIQIEMLNDIQKNLEEQKKSVKKVTCDKP